MSILSQLGFDNISKLEIAAEAGFAEASYLAEGGHHLTSIYLAGYAAEMTIGSAYFRLIFRYGPNRPIEDGERKRVIAAASKLSTLADKSHPLDGWVRLLIQDKSEIRPPSFDPKSSRRLVERVGEICEHWGPRLRYRSIQATRDQSRSVLLAARWVVDHCPEH